MGSMTFLTCKYACSNCFPGSLTPGQTLLRYLKLRHGHTQKKYFRNLARKGLENLELKTWFSCFFVTSLFFPFSIQKLMFNRDFFERSLLYMWGSPSKIPWRLSLLDQLALRCLIGSLLLSSLLFIRGKNVRKLHLILIKHFLQSTVAEILFFLFFLTFLSNWILAIFCQKSGYFSARSGPHLSDKKDNDTLFQRRKGIEKRFRFLIPNRHWMIRQISSYSFFFLER